jgi:hypothetical protein
MSDSKQSSGNLGNCSKPKRSGLIREYIYFLMRYKMWWLSPIFALMVVLGVLVVLGGSKAALLIYALF